MNTLTLHHILPYLPYGLMVEVTSTDGTCIEPFTAMQIKDGYEIAQISNTDYYLGEENDFTFKPHLYSLDDYRDSLKCKMLGLDNSKLEGEIYDFADGAYDIKEVSYAAIQAMAEAHIDMFRLIDAGLAVKKKIN